MFRFDCFGVAWVVAMLMWVSGIGVKERGSSGMCRYKGLASVSRCHHDWSGCRKQVAGLDMVFVLELIETDWLFRVSVGV